MKIYILNIDGIMNRLMHINLSSSYTPNYLVEERVARFLRNYPPPVQNKLAAILNDIFSKPVVIYKSIVYQDHTVSSDSISMPLNDFVGSNDIDVTVLSTTGTPLIHSYPDITSDYTNNILTITIPNELKYHNVIFAITGTKQNIGLVYNLYYYGKV
jgi:hypothetical protein